jgi:hypothetical protein
VRYPRIPSSMMATIRSVVAIGRRMKGADMGSYPGSAERD